MTRLALFALILCATPLANAQISAKLVMEDQRAGEHLLWLRWTLRPHPMVVEVLDARLELGRKEILSAESWEPCFENEQALTEFVAICRTAKDDKEQLRRVKIKGREIRTLHGRAWLIETIRTM